MKKEILLGTFNSLQSMFSVVGWSFATFRQPDRIQGMKTVQRVMRESDLRMTPLEANQLFMLVQATEKLGGAMAEIGVFRGASAKIIREADRVLRPLHLFDTFEGLPETQETDTTHNQGRFMKGQFACTLEDVQHYLRSSPNMHFHKGIFPSTGQEVETLRFSFVHSDVDLYESTKSVLEFFYPRMLTGGIILTHDFNAAGPNRAFKEFLAGKPETLVELVGDQAIVVKSSPTT